MTTREIYLSRLQVQLNSHGNEATLRKYLTEDELIQLQKDLASVVENETTLRYLRDSFGLIFYTYTSNIVNLPIRHHIANNEVYLLGIIGSDLFVYLKKPPAELLEKNDDFLDDLKRGVFFDTFDEPEPSAEKEESCSQCCDGFDIDFDEIDPEDLQFVQQLLSTEDKDFQPTFHNCVFNIYLGKPE